MEEDVSQVIEGYGCQCGFKTDDVSRFRSHLFKEGRKEKDKHHSLGRINLQTGDVILPPWGKRTQDEKSISRVGQKSKEKDKESAPTRSAEVLADATELRFVPRVFTIPLSNILLCAMTACHREFGWREDMPPGNFIDTVIYNWLLEHGIKVQAYVVDRPSTDGNGKENIETPQTATE